MPTKRGRPRALPPAFYDRPTLVVAEELLGSTLVHATPAGLASGMIVEVEAYIGEDDPACHAAPGPTRRNAPLYGPPGVAYVYLNYGLHNLVNAVTESRGRPAAVLIRALEPRSGVDLMRTRRSVVHARGVPRASADGSSSREVDLCRGPGNLTKALGITLAQNGSDLTASPLWIEPRTGDPGAVAWGPRIGIRVGVDRPWRCWLAGHPCVSGLRTQR